MTFALFKNFNTLFLPIYRDAQHLQEKNERKKNNNSETPEIKKKVLYLVWEGGLEPNKKNRYKQKH